MTCLRILAGQWQSWSHSGMRSQASPLLVCNWGLCWGPPSLREHGLWSQGSESPLTPL